MKFIEDIDKDSYKKLSDSHAKSHFLQSYEWSKFCENSKKQEAHYFAVEDKEKIIATVCVLLKKIPMGLSYGYAPRGITMDYSNKKLMEFITDNFNEYMKKNNIIYIKFDPDVEYQDIDENANPLENGNNNYALYDYMKDLGYKHTGFYKLYDGNQPRYTFRINLSQEMDNIDANIHKSFMKTLKRSYNYDLEIDNERNVEAFYKLIKINSEKDDFEAHNLDYYKDIIDRFDDEHVKFFNAYIYPQKLIEQFNERIANLEVEMQTSKKKVDIENQIVKYKKDLELIKDLKEEKILICSLVCLYTKNRAWTMYIGNDNLGSAFFAVTRCYYESVKDAKERNYDFIDFFGTVGDPKTKFKNLAGIYDFKSKFGGKYIEFIGEFDLVNKKFMYAVLPIFLKIHRKLLKLKRGKKQKMEIRK